MLGLCWCVEFVLRDCRQKTVYLVTLWYLNVLQTKSTIYSDFTVFWTCEQHRRVSAKSNNSLCCVYFLSITIFIKVSLNWGKIIFLKVPNFDSPVVCNTCEDRWGIRWPVNIINLLFKSLNLVTCKFGLWFLSTPNSNSPVVGTSKEYRAVVLVPKWITSDSIYRSSVTRVSFQILLRVRHWTHVNGAVFGRRKIGNILFTVLGEVNRKTPGIYESHTAWLLFDFSSSVDILLVRVRFSLQLHKLSVLESFPEWPLNDLAISWNRNQTFTFIFSLHPLDIPNDVSVLEI